MAGLFDSELARFLITPRAYFAGIDREKQTEQFKGLLGTLQQQGPVQPGGVLQSKSPDEQFWLKAATIPQFQQLAGQQLGYEASGNQALERQIQQQQYEGSNLTEAQRQQLLINQQDLARKMYGTEASAAASYASANRQNQGAAFDAARQPYDLSKIQAEAATKLQEFRDYLTPGQKQEQEVETASMKLLDAGRVKDMESNRSAEEWNSALADYADRSLKARRANTGLLTPVEDASLAAQRQQLVYQLAKQWSGGNAEPNPGVIEQAEAAIPRLGVVGDETFKATLQQLKRKPRQLRAPSTAKPPAGFSRKVTP